MLKSISRSPIVLKELLTTGEDLRKGLRSIKEIVRFDEEELAEEKIEKKTRYTVRTIDKIEKLYEVGLNQAARLERMPRSNKRGCLRAWRWSARSISIRSRRSA